MTILIAVVLSQAGWELRDDATAPAVVLKAEDVAVLHLLTELRLGPAQAAELASLADTAGRARADHAAAVAPEAKRLEEALDALRAEMLSGCGHATEELQKRATEAEGRVSELVRAYLARLKDLERRLPLRGAQVKRAAAYKPSLAAPRRASKRPASEVEELEEHVENLRNLPTKVLDRILDPLLDLVFNEHEPWRDMAEAERRSERQRIRKLMDSARALSALEFERRRSDFAWAVFDPDGASTTPDPSLTPAGRALLNPRVAALLRERAGKACEHDAPARPSALSGEKPDFEELADWLGLADDRRESARTAIGRGQAEFLDMLSLKREDGTIPLVEIFRLGMDGGGGDDLAALLAGKIPGRKETYFARSATIKLTIDAALRKSLGRDEFARYSTAKLDIFGVRVGDLRPYER